MYRRKFMIDPSSEEWKQKANCKNEPVDTFFPPARASLKAAKLICQECVVRSECLEYAINNDIEYGVWGGIGESGRNQIVRDRLWKQG